MPEDGFVECGRKRRALTPGRHVPTAKVCDDIDAGQLREERGIVKLDGESLLRPVSHGLAMTSDRPHGRVRHHGVAGDDAERTQIGAQSLSRVHFSADRCPAG